MFRHAFTSVLLVATMASVSPAVAAKESRPTAPAATNTQLLLFNLAPAGAYNVRRNGAPAGTSVAGPSGVIAYAASVNAGDRLEFTLTGIDPVDPARPGGFVATGNNQGCVVATWNAPSAGEYVTDYSLLWGVTAGAYTDSVTVRGTDIAKGAKWATTRCGFADGSYVFALRAHNSFDRWSTLSQPSSTTITNQDAQPPLPPTNVRVREASPGCAAVTWTRSSDPSVTGYRISHGTRPRSQAAYTDSLDVATVGGQLCGLTAGNHYFAVRAFNAAGELSAYSAEVVLGPANAASEVAGAILPNGYWANDPARPLEIRNLPGEWSVRIFDASGVAVRSHTNHAEGATWAWNFRNDQGWRVAPALYLVRVTDPAGVVQTTGRFLVQSGQ